ncbi:TRAP transporter large permease [Desulfovibrio litoralis]|uniref:C4-dicarboxylate transporter, DctM subunit n=1 Tax=Desulfovibrio litoralis DSM 11393 TaxID=1121455 RepID=A0A1M7TBQ0_9BACT|nr:TRAP transporter large permease [Desulfovibrio litoralis]SHN68152.1 C4-dicarboxylate transporter, DctM subunit [Desulfovibrio litoralis DSM 11393]
MDITVLIWIALFFLLFIGVPIFVAIGAATVFVLFFSSTPMSIIPLDLYKITEMFPLLAVPAFILAGSLMEKGNIAGQIVEFCEMLVGRMMGGLGIVTILGCMFFAAIIGSGPGTVAAMGSLMIPSMIRRGYSIDYASGVCATGGTLGILIPPSNPMILYGVIANVSISSLFLAGVVPGLTVGLVLMLTAYAIAKKKGFGGSTKKHSVKDVMVCFRKNFFALMTPVIILGGIYSGIFTPVEASCVAVFYALLLGIVNKALDWEGFIVALRITILSVSTMVVVVGVSMLFGHFLTLYQVPQKLTALLLGVTDNATVVLYLIVIFLFFLGMFMDTLATIVILAPILIPVITKFGIDPIFFGIIWVMANEIALLSPPLGPNLFIVMNITNISLERATKAIIPFTLALIITIFMFVSFGQELVLWLPNLIGK